MLVADLAEMLEERLGGGDIAALANDRFDKDGGCVFWGGLLLEEIVDGEVGLANELLLGRLLGNAHGVPVWEGGGVDAWLGSARPDSSSPSEAQSP